VVENGALLVDGALGNTAVTVASGKLLGGDGTIGGSVTASAGAFLSPGTEPFTGATMTVGGGLTLNAATMYGDLSGSPGGANDKIAVNGTLTYAGTPFFQFYLIDGSLGAGNYHLVTATGSVVPGGTPGAFPHNLPAGTRQTFTVKRSSAGANPSLIWLEVLGDPATLTWTGATNSTWDTTTADNWTGATPNTFGANDAVILDDTSGNRNLTLAGVIAPRSIVVNTSAGYTFAGAGITGTGTLTKTGIGALTVSNTGAGDFSGGTFLNGGGIVLTNSTANTNGLGTGTITFNGGTLTMAGFNGSNADSYAPMPNGLIVPNGATGTLNLTQRAFKPGAANVFPAINGPLSGGGTLNLAIKFLRGDVLGDWSAFSGVLNVVPGDADGGDFRFGTSYYWPGMPAATVNLGNNMAAYYVGTTDAGAGTTVEFGELSGVASSKLFGGTTGGRNFYYRIGGKTQVGGEVVFAGTIGEQNGSVTTAYTKTGAGTWTLSGSGAWNGGTTIEQGTLKISGTFTCLSATEVQTGASLAVAGGSLATDSVSLAGGASLSGYGTLTGDLNAGGTLDGRGFATGTPGTLTVNGNAFLGSSALTRLRGGVSSDLVTVSGDLALGGTVQVSLAPGTGFGRYPLFTYGGTLTGSAALTGIPGGTTAHLSTTTAGQVALVIDDSDEDGLPDSWELAHFSDLAQDAGDDSDGDGTPNLAELRLGLDPSDGSSAFKATISGHTLSWPSAPGIVFTVRRDLTLDGSWGVIGTVTGGAGNTASFTDPDTLDRAFYRVEFTP
jgi:fibronectin-binding autotransporter adhesin